MLPSSSSKKPSDKEPFTTRDHIARRKTYLKCDFDVIQKLKSRRVKHLTSLNFTKNDFHEGATNWSDLKDLQLQLLCTYFNAMAYTVGNKTKVLVGASKPKGRASAKFTPQALQSEENVTAGYVNDRFICVCESLFEEKRGNCVYGFRWDFFEFETQKGSGASFISKGLQDSFPECQEVIAYYEKSKNTKTLQPPKHTEKLEQYKELDRSLRYMKSQSMTSLYLKIFSNYGYNDKYRTLRDSDDILDESKTYFIDERNLREELDISRIFSFDSALMYNVINRVQSKQCSFSTYFRPTLSDDSSDAANDEGEEEEVKEELVLPNKPAHLLTISNTRLNGKYDFIDFYNRDTTYYLEPSRLLPEYIVKMPLPHLIGSLLECEEDQIAAAAVAAANSDNTDASIDKLFQTDDDLVIEKILSSEPDDRSSKMDDDLIIMYGSDDDDTNTMVNSSYISSLRRGEMIMDNTNEDGGKLKKRKTPLGMHSTVHNPEKYEILSVKRIGRFANLDTNSKVSEKTIADYKRTQEIIVESALLQSCKHTLKEKTLFSGDYAKNWKTPLETVDDQPYYAETPRITTRNGNVVDDNDDDEDNNNEGGDGDDNEGGYHNFSHFEEMAGSKNLKMNAKEYEKRMEEYRLFCIEEMSKYDHIRAMSETEIMDQCQIANGNLEMFKETIRRYRPIENDLETVIRVIPTPTHSLDQLKKDVFCRLFELNVLAYHTLNKRFVRANGSVKSFDEKAYRHEYQQLYTALTIEVIHEFMNNDDVTNPCKEIRKYFKNLEYTTNEGIKVSPISCDVVNFQIDARPYDQYKIYLQQFFTSQDGLDVRNNYKNMDTIFHARLHHCRHFIGANFPSKNNILVQGDPGGGKSFQIKEALKCMVPGVVKYITQFTGNSLLVDGNKSDEVWCIEEMPPEFLGCNDKGKGGSDSGNISDAASIFKGVLTAGESSKMRAHYNKDTGETIEVDSKAQIQVEVIGACNPSLTRMDNALIDRFIILHQISSKDGRAPMNQIPLALKSHDSNKRLVTEVIEMHRVYYVMEQMMKANVLGVNRGSGVNMTVADVLVPQILDLLQFQHNIPTSNPRKRVFVNEMARTKTLHFVVWQALKSPLFQHFQYYPSSDPNKRIYIGFNPRMIIGMFPHLFVGKSEVIDTLVGLSTLWQSDHLLDILTYVTNESKVVQYLKEHDHLNLPPQGEPIPHQYETLIAEAKAKQQQQGAPVNNVADQQPQPQPQQKGDSGRTTWGKQAKRRKGEKKNDPSPAKDKPFFCFKRESNNNQKNPWVNSGNNNNNGGSSFSSDYNYLAIGYGSKIENFFKKVANNAILEKKGHLSDKYVAKVFEELSEEYGEELPSYVLNPITGRLEYEVGSEKVRRKIIDYGKNNEFGLGSSSSVVYILVSFLKNRLPHIFTDDLVEDLTKIPDAKYKKDTERRRRGVDESEESEEAEKEVDQEQETIVVEEEEEEAVTPKSTEQPKQKNAKKREGEGEEEGEEDANKRSVAYYQELLERMALVKGAYIDNSLLDCIKTVLDNPVLEKIKTLGFDGNKVPRVVMTDEKDEEYRRYYGDAYFNYIITEPIKDVMHLSKLFTDVPALTRKQAARHDVIHFDRYLKKITLERQEGGKLIRLRNMNYQSISSQSILLQTNPMLNAVANRSLHHGSGKTQEKVTGLVDITRKNRRIFNDSAIVEFTEDIDWEVMKSHFSDLSIKIPSTFGDARQSFMAWPTFMYMLHVDFFNAISTKFIELFPLDTKDGNFDQLVYPICDMIQEIHMAHTSLQHEFSLKVTDKSKIIQFNALSAANFETGDSFLFNHFELKSQEDTTMFNMNHTLPSKGLDYREGVRNYNYRRQFTTLLNNGQISEGNNNNNEKTTTKGDKSPNTDVNDQKPPIDDVDIYESIRSNNRLRYNPIRSGTSSSNIPWDAMTK